MNLCARYLAHGFVCSVLLVGLSACGDDDGSSNNDNSSMDETVKSIPGPDKSLITAIDAFENVWFDVVDAALARLFPKVHAKVLKNLKKTSGVMVVINVSTLLERIGALESSADNDEKAAFAELERRGLDKSQRDYAQGLIDRATIEPVDPSDEPGLLARRGPASADAASRRGLTPVVCQISAGRRVAPHWRS